MCFVYRNMDTVNIFRPSEHNVAYEVNIRVGISSDGAKHISVVDTLRCIGFKNHDSTWNKLKKKNQTISKSCYVYRFDSKKPSPAVNQETMSLMLERLDGQAKVFTNRNRMAPFQGVVEQ